MSKTIEKLYKISELAEESLQREQYIKKIAKKIPQSQRLLLYWWRIQLPNST